MASPVCRCLDGFCRLSPFKPRRTVAPLRDSLTRGREALTLMLVTDAVALLNAHYATRPNEWWSMYYRPILEGIHVPAGLPPSPPRHGFVPAVEPLSSDDRESLANWGFIWDGPIAATPFDPKLLTGGLPPISNEWAYLAAAQMYTFAVAAFELVAAQEDAWSSPSRMKPSEARAYRATRPPHREYADRAMEGFTALGDGWADFIDSPTPPSRKALRTW